MQHWILILPVVSLWIVLLKKYNDAVMPLISILITVVTLLGAVGLFLFGMKLMSEALQKVAGQRMRSIISAITLNPIRGLASGLVLTATIQSSSASTVMITGLVNAGLLTLRQSLPIILGANIGTTFKVWIISLIGFRFDLNQILLPAIAISMVFLFSASHRRKSIGELLMGFALLFLGLEMLKNYMPVLNENPGLVDFLKNFNSGGYLSVLLFVLVGAVFTSIIQSSSASIALTLAMLHSGWFTYDHAVAMVLGENIGTTITANLAAIVANTQAKRAALAHFLFNALGVLFVLLWFYPFIQITNWLTTGILGQSPTSNTGAMLFALSVVHTSFNLMNALIWINLTKVMMRLTTSIIPEKEHKKRLHQRFIGNKYLLSTSELSILQAKKEIQTMAKLVGSLYKIIPDILVEKDPESYKALDDKIQGIKKEIELTSSEVERYLFLLNENDLSLEGKTRKKVMTFVNNQLSTMMQVNLQMVKIVEEKNEKKVWFSPKQRLNLNKMFDLVKESLRVMTENLSGEYHLAQFDYSIEIEESINQLRDKLKMKTIHNIEKGKYSVEGGNFYNELFSLSEKIGDHIILINGSLASCRLQVS